MNDFGWTLIPLVALLWMYGGADWPMDALESKLWRRLGVGLALCAYGLLAHLNPWWCVSVIPLAWALTSLGYGDLIERRDWRMLAVLGLGYGTISWPLLLAARCWWALSLTPLVAAGWVGGVWLSNHPRVQMPWKICELTTGMAVGAACIPALLP